MDYDLVKIEKNASLREALDNIDSVIVAQTFNDFFFSRKRILIGIWEKGAQIAKSVASFRGVNDATNWLEMSRNTGRIRRDLQAWYKTFIDFPDIKEYEKVAEKKALAWTQKALGIKAQLTQDEPAEALPFPDGKYQVIYADPPWPVGSITMDKWESPIDDKYPTMSIEEITALPVQTLAADICSLFLWTTHTFLHDSLHIMDAWGFKYFCIITWDKGGGWTQNGFHKKTELLLYGYKGKINVDPYGDAIPTLISKPKGAHSEKPDLIRDMITRKIDGNRLELFARNKSEGWDVWGNDERIK